MKKSSVFGWVLVAVVLIILLGWGTISKIFSGKSTEQTTREVAMSCTTDMATQFHIHPNLKIIMDGKVEAILANIGIIAGCMHPLHTHDETGTIHVESPVKRDFTLGDLFAVWDRSIEREGKTLKATVGGVEVLDPQSIILRDLQEIVLEYK